MKKVMIQTTAMLMLVLFIFSCKKNDTSASSPAINAAKTDGIQRGEPVLFAAQNLSNTEPVTWTVSPSANVVVRNQGNAASILFGQNGTYSITAASGTKVATSSVSVTASNFIANTSATSQPVTGDKISITPSVISVSGDHDSVIVALSATTSNTYDCLNNYLIGTYNYTQASNEFKISYSGVSSPTDCHAGKVKASGMQFLYPLAQGSNKLSIDFNGTTYSGTITRTGDSFTFTWPYSDGVTISPLTVSK